VIEGRRISSTREKGRHQVKYRFLLFVTILAGAMPIEKAHALPDASWGNCTRSIDMSADARLASCNDIYYRKECEKYGLLPDCDEIRFRRGQAYLDKGEYRLAIKDYDMAIKQRETPVGASLPELVRYTTAEVYLQRGVAYALAGDLSRAQQDIDEAGRGWDGVNDIQLRMRIRVVGTHLIMIENGVEPLSELRGILEGKITIVPQ
jgi:tetratricopeptide (TPR) repeat protein